jgi:anti-sigma28 factor (negative regulator of flagellin synthesis)
VIRKTNGTLAAQSITAEKRKDKTAALRQAVGEGTYRVKASETAAKIINKFFFQLLAG